MSPRVGLGSMKKEKNLFPLPETRPQFLYYEARNLFAIPTALPQRDASTSGNALTEITSLKWISHVRSK